MRASAPRSAIICQPCSYGQLSEEVERVGKIEIELNRKKTIFGFVFHETNLIMARKECMYIYVHHK